MAASYAVTAMSASLPSQPSRALLCDISDPRLRQYLQSFPFATGPDPSLNQQSLRDLQKSLVIRSPRSRPTIVLRSTRDSQPADAVLARARRLASAAGMDQASFDRACADLAWKVAHISPEAESLFALGCGAGDELLFLRALLPKARIAAFDWSDRAVNRRILDVAEVSFTACDFVAHLASSSVRADAIFMNHVLEHVYQPVSVLRSMSRMLNSSGTLVSAQPLEMLPNGPTSALLLELAEHADQLHAFDLMLLNAGHCWKTNPSDLDETLAEAGFTDRAFFQRSDFLSRHVCTDRSAFERQKRLARSAYVALFRAPEKLARHTMARPSWMTLKAWFAVQSRSALGASALQRKYCEELVLRASN